MRLLLCAPARSWTGYLCKKTHKNYCTKYWTLIRRHRRLIKIGLLFSSNENVVTGCFCMWHRHRLSAPGGDAVLFCQLSQTLAKLLFLLGGVMKVKGKGMTGRLLICLEATILGLKSVPKGNVWEAPTFGVCMSGFTRKWAFLAQRSWKLSPGCLCPSLKTLSC